MKPTLIVLAAGMGSRYGGLKQLDGVGPNGETIMDYSVFDAARAGFGKVVFIIRKHFRAAFEKTFATRYGSAIEVAFVEQEPEKELPQGFTPPPERTKPWGTAHATLMAAPEVDTPFAVINADDFYGREAFQAMGDFLRSGATASASAPSAAVLSATSASATSATVLSATSASAASASGASHSLYAMMGYQVGNTLSDSGGVSRGICSVNERNLLTQVVECHHIRAIPCENTLSESDSAFLPPSGSQQIVFETDSGNLTRVPPDTPVSMNFWGFTPDFFSHIRHQFHTFIHDHGEELKSEFYIPTVVNHLIQTQQSSVQMLVTNALWFGVTYQEDRPFVIAQIRSLIAQGAYPETLNLVR